MSLTPELWEELMASVGPPPRPSSTMKKVPLPVDAGALRLPRLRAYVDETGDRGASKSASPIFGMASVIVTDLAEREARAALQTLRADFGTPIDRPLSWKEDVRRDHDRAVHAAETLATVRDLQVVYVVAEKDALDPGTYKSDVTLFYNFTAYAVLLRTLFAARHWSSSGHQVEIRFGHVARHPSTDTYNYFQIKRQREPQRPWHLLTHLSWVSATQYEMSQVADLYGGFLKAATWPNGYGRVEPAYLRRVWTQIRQVQGCPINLGFMYRPSDDLLRAKDWWPCGCRKCS